MRPPQISLEEIVALEPACLRMTVPEAYRDENGHMNVRWYAAIFDDAGDALHARLGLTPEFHKAHGTGTMDLENHFNYLHEVRAGDRLWLTGQERIREGTVESTKPIGPELAAGVAAKKCRYGTPRKLAQLGYNILNSAPPASHCKALSIWEQEP